MSRFGPYSHGYGMELTHHGRAHDPGLMYKEEWVRNLIRQISRYVKEHRLWLGVDRVTPQRVLDYACGNGTISSALAPDCRKTIFQGIDILPAQVGRFYEAARTLLGDDEARWRMFAIQGNLLNPGPELRSSEWMNFDVAVISMGLHHIEDPVAMIRLLRQRVRRGGVVVVIDWFTQECLGEGFEPGHPFLSNEARMVSVDSDLKIWPGFTMQGIIQTMNEAGLQRVDIRPDPRKTKVPEKMGGESQLFYARGIVP